MERKLILTPFEHGALWLMHKVFNEGNLSEQNDPLDIPHLLLAAVTMAGVDRIHSIGTLQNTNTTLIKKIVTKTSVKEWINCEKQVDETLKMYSLPRKSNEPEAELRSVRYFISHLFFAMETNSVVLYLGDLDELRNQSFLSPELNVPLKILLSSIQTKNANLPIVKYDIDKKDIKKLIEIIGSKEFNFYKEAQSEIETNKNLTTKTINLIEKAGKDLYRRNSNILNINESIIKAIPLSSKVIDLCFGRLPGILTEYVSKTLTDYLNTNKTIPIYNYDSFITGLLTYRKITTEKQLKAKLNLDVS